MIRRATLNDVAREAGVSIKTASRVLSGVETVNQTLRDKVQRAAAGLDYRPNRAAAMMRSFVTSRSAAVSSSGVSPASVAICPR